MGEPRRVVLAGDWHGDFRWAAAVIAMLPELLPEESPRRLLQLGDFGFAPRGPHIQALAEELSKVDGELWWVDGNHEYWNQLTQPDLADDLARRRTADRIWWLPRGHRWQWHGRTWLAAGGAISVDRALRTPGLDWFPDEEMTWAQAEAIAADGPADVVVAHDCPDGVDLHLEPVPAYFGWAQGDLDRSAEHRATMAMLAVKVGAQWWMHGHYHLRHRSIVDLGAGLIEVTGLHMNHASGSYAILDVQAMQWQPF